MGDLLKVLRPESISPSRAFASLIVNPNVDTIGNVRPLVFVTKKQYPETWFQVSVVVDIGLPLVYVSVK
jgi:hypothetical protein